MSMPSVLRTARVCVCVCVTQAGKRKRDGVCVRESTHLSMLRDSKCVGMDIAGKIK